MSISSKLRNPKTSLVAVLLLAVLATGCQTTKSAKSFAKSIDEKKLQTSLVSGDSQKITQDPWSFIQNQLQIEIPDNKRIVTEKDKLIKNKLSLETNVLRSEPYIYYILNQLNERNMPVELALVPLIESAYNPLATSYAKAAGLWQIVPITAEQYGLTKNSWYDPRRDLIESTDTAINLLQYLNQQFEGDWLLTLAAYNAGEGRVKRAIAWNKSKGLPTNFWALNLPKETMQYIPKFLAITDIIRNNNQYNIALPNCAYENSLVRLDLSKQISLEKIAEYSGISMDELLEYNAGYLKKVVKGPYHLFIPANYAQTLYQKLQASNLTDSQIIDLLQLEDGPIESKYNYFNANLTNTKYVNITDRDIRFYEKEHKRYSQIVHQIKSGDNLSSIAKKYNVKISDIVKWNKIQNPHKLKLGDKLKIEIKNGSSS